MARARNHEKPASVERIAEALEAAGIVFEESGCVNRRGIWGA